MVMPLVGVHLSCKFLLLLRIIYNENNWNKNAIFLPPNRNCGDLRIGFTVAHFLYHNNTVYYCLSIKLSLSDNFQNET